MLSNSETTDNYIKIPLDTIDSADCLAHLDKKGFKYYIPILMQRLIQNYDPSSMMVIGTLQALHPKKDNAEYYNDKYSLLTTNQKSAIAFFSSIYLVLLSLIAKIKKLLKDHLTIIGQSI